MTAKKKVGRAYMPDNKDFMAVKKILLVDDSRGWLDYHQDALKELFGAQFAVETANCAREGYNMIYNNLKEPYDLIISDLQMELDFEPKSAGEWFIEQVKMMKEYKKVPVIIVSAMYNIKTIAQRLDVNYLPKASAASDLTAYKLAIQEALEI